MKSLIIAFFFILVVLSQSVDEKDIFCRDPDCELNTTQLIQSKGYTAEEHTITTRDGYLISIQRIPHGKTNAPYKGAVLLQHGLLDASHTWVLNFPSQSLGFILADAGYDVWLGNTRGNTYGRRHTKLNPKDPLFWDFSFDELIADDLPSMINYVRAKSGQDKIFYIGHSQGTMMGFAGFTNDTLASKIRLYVALAPVAYVANIKVSLLRYLAEYDMEELMIITGQYEFAPSTPILEAILSLLCTFDKNLCMSTMCALMGCDTDNWNNTRWPVYTHHDPAGTSCKNIAHFAQLVRDNKYQMFDYGPTENTKRYNQKTPPLYDLSKVKTKVALFSATNDYLADPTDFQRLKSELPKNSIVKELNIEEYSHIDFIWGLNANEKLYKVILELFANY